MNVLVTGGCGYIGSVLLPQLQADADIDEITVLDSLVDGSPRNLFGGDVTTDFQFRQGDVRNYGDVEDAVRGSDSIIHLAAITGADDTHEIRDKTYDVNLNGTDNVLRAARKFNVDNVVFAWSCNNYGRATSMNIDETVDPDPINPYAETKYKSESLLAEFIEDTGGTATALRMSTNYGYAPGMRFNLVINHFVFRALTNHPLTVYGDGTNWRPFIHVRDSAAAFKHAICNPDQWQELVYNVGSNESNYQIADIAEIVREEIDRELDITYLRDKNPGPSYHVNFDRLGHTGFEPEWTLRDGIRELADKFTDQQPQITTPTSISHND